MDSIIRPISAGTLREIAFEKAGIIKPGVPVVIGHLEPEAFEAIAAVAHERNAELVETAATDLDGVAVGLAGAHQRGNAAVALRLLTLLDGLGISVPPRAIADGLAHTDWPGRLDRRRLPDGREALLDAAHNPAGAAALASYLLEQNEVPRPLVFAAMRDKDVDGMFAALLPSVSHLVITRASNTRSAEPAALAEVARAIAPGLSITIEASLDHALAIAWRLSPRIVVAGSIFLLGDVLKRLRAS